MKTALPTLLIPLHKTKSIAWMEEYEHQENTSIELVFACAWCPPKDYKKLRKNQQYTHGICQKHKEQFIVQIRQKVVRI